MQSWWFSTFFCVLVCVCVIQIFVGGQTIAQSTTRKHLVHVSQNEGDTLHAFTDSIEAATFIQDRLHYLHNSGYIEAACDSVSQTDSSYRYWCSSGALYHWLKLRSDTFDMWFRKAGVKPHRLVGKPFQFSQWEQMQKRVVDYWANRGYPFISVSLQNIKINPDGGVEAQPWVSPGTLFLIDTLYIQTDARIKNYFLENYLNIRSGQVYNESKMGRLDRKLNELDFLRPAAPSRVVFTSSSAVVAVYPVKRRAGSLYGIIGFLPDDKVRKKLLVTGELDLKLINQFGRGESVGIHWRKLQVQTQELHVEVGYPYLFRSFWGIDGSFDLYKRDTSYLTTNSQAGLRYQFSGPSYLRFYLDYRNSAELTTLPNSPYTSFSTLLYGAEIFYSQLDYRFNPSKGNTLRVSAATGSRNHTNIDQPERQVRYEFKGLFEQYVRLFPSTTWLLRNRSAVLTGTTFFENELYRLGGIQSLRGFDENSIYTSLYSIFTTEFRYLFDQNSNFFAFIDYAYVEQKGTDAPFSDTPYGFGAGLNLETNAGVFSITWALGTRKDNPMQFRSAKIHLGYITRF